MKSDKIQKSFHLNFLPNFLDLRIQIILNKFFYNNYKLKIYNSDLGWFYKIDKYYSTISSGLITLNFGGKILFSICGYGILIGLLTLFFKFYMWYLFTLPIICLIIYCFFYLEL